MEKKNLDWENIGFAYHQTDMRAQVSFSIVRRFLKD